MPVVACVHTNQEPQALATITWCNEFTEEVGRNSLSMAAYVPWWKMENVLTLIFLTQTGRGLSTENLQYLCESLVFCL